MRPVGEVKMRLTGKRSPVLVIEDVLLAGWEVVWEVVWCPQRAVCCHIIGLCMCIWVGYT